MYEITRFLGMYDMSHISSLHSLKGVIQEIGV